MKKKICLLLAILLLFPALAGAETIVTSFYPIWILALNLTDGLEGVEVINLTEPVTGCLHDYYLLPSDKVTLSRADILLINGAGMEAFIPAAIASLPFSAKSGMLEIGGHEEGEEVNAHLWLDPQRAAGMAANLAEGLILLLPDREQQITENLKAYQERLYALDETLRDGLSGFGRKVIIFHEAFPYFAEACGLSAIAIVNKDRTDQSGGNHAADPEIR